MEEHPSLNPNPRPSTPKPAEKPSGRPALTPLQFDLARSLPPLWKKANNKHLTAKEQHKKMLELIVWVAFKHGFKAQQRYPIQYWHNHVKKDGRIDIALFDSKDVLALLIELDWTKNDSSVHKLQAGSLLKKPILWIAGVPAASREDAKQLRVFANQSTGKPTGWWLPLFHLEHGWL